MISKTYYRYIWLLDTLLTKASLTIDEINTLWEDCPASDGQPIPLRTSHERQTLGIFLAGFPSASSAPFLTFALQR